MTRINLAAWQASARTALAPTSENPGMEAQLLLVHTLQRRRTWVIAHPEVEITSSQQDLLSDLLARLIAGTPLPYLTGHQEFFGLDFHISPAVLIPRPETELLVERALHWIQSQPAVGRGVDVGTGSGCIAISLAHHLPGLQIDAIDRSFSALEIAAGNAIHHQVNDRVHLIQGDLLTPLSGPYSLICANLPYIPSATLPGLPVARYEPLEALDGGEDGLYFIKRLLEQVCRVLHPTACILLEIEYRQAALAAALADEFFPQAQVQFHQDLAGQDRLLEIHLENLIDKSEIG